MLANSGGIGFGKAIRREVAESAEEDTENTVEKDKTEEEVRAALRCTRRSLMPLVCLNGRKRGMLACKLECDFSLY